VNGAAGEDWIKLIAWRRRGAAGNDWSAWHVEAVGDRSGTRCNLTVPDGARVSRRLASRGNWPRICGGCRHAVLKDARRTIAERDRPTP
jgi:hypothetical protein